MKRAGVAVLAATLAACHSPPVRYYVLSEVKGHERAEGLHSAPADPLPLRLERVRLPGELDRSQLVRRIDANRLQVEANSRWAAPLDEMIRRVLSADLAGRLSPGKVVEPYQPLPAGQVHPLWVDIHELYGDSHCAVSLRASWMLSGTPTAAPGAREEVQVAPAGPCPDALAATMSQALGVLADRIAAAIARPGG